MSRNLAGFIDTPWYRRSERVVSLLANVAVALGVVVAFYEIRRANQLESRRIAVEATAHTRSPDFVRAYARLKTTVTAGQATDRASVVEDLNYVVNVYDQIAVLTMNDVADVCIVKQSIGASLQEVRDLLGKVAYPQEYRQNLDLAADLLSKRSCGR